jgi:hypothetical protein
MSSSNNGVNIPVGKIVLGVGVIIVILFVVGFAKSLVGWNPIESYQVVQPLKGSPYVVDQSGYYGKWLGTNYSWPIAYTQVYNDVEDERDIDSEAIAVTFNDGGNARQSTAIRFALPTDPQLRIKLHKQFNGSMKNVILAVKAHMMNCCKAAAPLMSSSENQSARKTEYQQVTEEMIRKGIYEMRKVDRELKDRTDEKGKPIMVYATEIITDKNGMPIIASPSPLQDLGITILQFSVTETKYDDQILKQFEAKKDSFLRAEQSKAQREAEVQERLMVVEKFKKEQAQVEGEANKLQAKAVIEAEQKVKVALQTKIEAETVAAQKVTVAAQAKLEAETLAQQKLSVASLNAQAAVKDAEAIVTLADAQEKKIIKAGAITEKDRVTLEYAMNTKIEVAKALSGSMRMPTTVITGGGTNGSVQGTDLMNVFMLKQLGAIEDLGKSSTTEVKTTQK